MILEADANLEDALPLLVKAGFYHAGQVCVSVQQIYAHRSIAEGLAQKIAEKAAKLVVGDPADLKTEIGPLISHAENDRVAAWVEEGVKKGDAIRHAQRPVDQLADEADQHSDGENRHRAKPYEKRRCCGRIMTRDCPPIGRRARVIL